ncbi:hypothetical protein ACNPIL_27070, partial [Klebsiella pneumoniae]
GYQTKIQPFTDGYCRKVIISQINSQQHRIYTENRYPGTLPPLAYQLPVHCTALLTYCRKKEVKPDTLPAAGTDRIPGY